jgi:hypothetical protein
MESHRHWGRGGGIELAAGGTPRTKGCTALLEVLFLNFGSLSPFPTPIPPSRQKRSMGLRQGEGVDPAP